MTEDGPLYTDEPVDVYIINMNPYPRGWKFLAIFMPHHPKGLTQWFNFLWGMDIWYSWFPVIKAMIASNILMWILLWI